MRGAQRHNALASVQHTEMRSMFTLCSLFLAIRGLTHLSSLPASCQDLTGKDARPLKLMNRSVCALIQLPHPIPPHYQPLQVSISEDLHPTVGLFFVSFLETCRENTGAKRDPLSRLFNKGGCLKSRWVGGLVCGSWTPSLNKPGSTQTASNPAFFMSACEASAHAADRRRRR